MADPIQGDCWDTLSRWLESSLGHKHGSNERARKAVGWLRWLVLSTTTQTESALSVLGRTSNIAVKVVGVAGKATWRRTAPSVRALTNRVRLPPAPPVVHSSAERIHSVGRWLALFVLSGGTVLVPTSARSAEDIMADVATEAAAAREPPPNAKRQVDPAAVSVWVPPTPGSVGAAAAGLEVALTAQGCRGEVLLAARRLPAPFLRALAALAEVQEKEKEGTSGSGGGGGNPNPNSASVAACSVDGACVAVGLLAAALALNPSPLLRAVPLAPPTEQRQTLELVESLDVLEPLPFLTALDDQGAPLSTALEACMWHLKLCRALAAAVESSATSFSSSSSLSSSLLSPSLPPASGLLSRRRRGGSSGAGVGQLSLLTPASNGWVTASSNSTTMNHSASNAPTVAAVIEGGGFTVEAAAAVSAILSCLPPGSAVTASRALHRRLFAAATRFASNFQLQHHQQNHQFPPLAFYGLSGGGDQGRGGGGGGGGGVGGEVRIPAAAVSLVVAQLILRPPAWSLVDADHPSAASAPAASSSDATSLARGLRLAQALSSGIDPSELLATNDVHSLSGDKENEDGGGGASGDTQKHPPRGAKQQQQQRTPPSLSELGVVLNQLRLGRRLLKALRTLLNHSATHANSSSSLNTEVVSKPFSSSSSSSRATGSSSSSSSSSKGGGGGCGDGCAGGVSGGGGGLLLLAAWDGPSANAVEPCVRCVVEALRPWYSGGGLDCGAPTSSCGGAATAQSASQPFPHTARYVQEIAHQQRQLLDSDVVLRKEGEGEEEESSHEATTMTLASKHRPFVFDDEDVGSKLLGMPGKDDADDGDYMNGLHLETAWQQQQQQQHQEAAAAAAVEAAAAAVMTAAEARALIKAEAAAARSLDANSKADASAAAGGFGAVRWVVFRLDDALGRVLCVMSDPAQRFHLRVQLTGVKALRTILSARILTPEIANDDSSAYGDGSDEDGSEDSEDDDTGGEDDGGGGYGMRPAAAARKKKKKHASAASSSSRRRRPPPDPGSAVSSACVRRCTAACVRALKDHCFLTPPPLSLSAAAAAASSSLSSSLSRDQGVVDQGGGGGGHTEEQRGMKKVETAALAAGRAAAGLSRESSSSSSNASSSSYLPSALSPKLKQGAEVRGLVVACAELLADLTQAPSTSVTAKQQTASQKRRTATNAPRNRRRGRGVGARGGRLLGDSGSEDDDEEEEEEEDEETLSSSAGALTTATTKKKRKAANPNLVAAAAPSYAAVAGSGGLSSLAEAMLAASDALAHVLANHALSSSSSPSPSSSISPSSSVEPTSVSASTEVSDLCDVQRFGLAVFARHDVLDDTAVKRCGGKAALEACIRCLKCTNRARGVGLDIESPKEIDEDGIGEEEDGEGEEDDGGEEEEEEEGGEGMTLKWEWPQATAGRTTTVTASASATGDNNYNYTESPTAVSSSASSPNFGSSSSSSSSRSSSRVVFLPAVLSRPDAEALGGLAVMACVQLLLRVSAHDMVGLHVATAKGDVSRIRAEIGLRADDAAALFLPTPGRTTTATTSSSSSSSSSTSTSPLSPPGMLATSEATADNLQYVDTARWFFEHCRGLEHIRAAVGLRGGFNFNSNLAAARVGGSAAARASVGGGGGGTTNTAVSLAGQWAMRTLEDHWPEFVGGGGGA